MNAYRLSTKFGKKLSDHVRLLILNFQKVGSCRLYDVFVLKLIQSGYRKLRTIFVWSISG